MIILNKNLKKGFTIVELLVVIVVLGILAALLVLAYVGIQKRAVDTTLAHTLSSASRAMHVSAVESGSYPSSLPPNVHSTPEISLALKAPSTGNVYGALTAGQNGLLFYDTCNQLVSEGVGSRSDGNNYMSGCQVFNKNQLHVNGWNGRDININIVPSSLDTYVSSYSGGQPDLFATNATDFMTQWKTRFQAAGGTFPVTLFWDSWATSSNGGVMKPTMPAPISSGSGQTGTTYCIEATHTKTSAVWHITEDSLPAAGACS